MLWALWLQRPHKDTGGTTASWASSLPLPPAGRPRVRVTRDDSHEAPLARHWGPGAFPLLCLLRDPRIAGTPTGSGQGHLSGSHTPEDHAGWPGLPQGLSRNTVHGQLPHPEPCARWHESAAAGPAKPGLPDFKLKQHPKWAHTSVLEAGGCTTPSPRPDPMFVSLKP